MKLTTDGLRALLLCVEAPEPDSPGYEPATTAIEKLEAELKRREERS